MKESEAAPGDSHSWIENLTETCKRRDDAREISRELYGIPARYADSAFTTLVNAIRSDIGYFRERCPDREPVLSIKEVGPQEFSVWTQGPYDSIVKIWVADARIDYEIRARPDPRSSADVTKGYMLVKGDSDRNIWLEHDGKAINYVTASRFLIEDLLRSLF
ncbi:MAG: hypothetical protein WBE37_27525 [Bryobacteraceae bacterium]